MRGGGLLRGIGLGALAGAIVSLEALETSQYLFDFGGSAPRSDGGSRGGSRSSGGAASFPGASALSFLSRFSGLQVCFFRWRTSLSADGGFDNALRELRLPPAVLIRLSSAAQVLPGGAARSSRYTYPTSSDIEGGPPREAALFLDATTGPPGLSPDQLRRVPYKTYSKTQVRLFSAQNTHKIEPSFL